MERAVGWRMVNAEEGNRAASAAVGVDGAFVWEYTGRQSQKQWRLSSMRRCANAWAAAELEAVGPLA